MANPYNLQVGQEIFLEPQCNALIYSDKIVKAKITEIKNKYFKVIRDGYTTEDRNRYHNDSLSQDGGQYRSDWQGYITLQEIEDRIERNKLTLYFGFEVFKYGNNCKNLSIDQLRRIKSIIDEGESKDGI